MWAPLERLRSSRGAGAVAIAVIAGLMIGFLLVPSAPAPGDPGGPPPRINLLGEPLGLGDGAPAEALERVRRFVARPFRAEAARRLSAASSTSAGWAPRSTSVRLARARAGREGCNEPAAARAPAKSRPRARSSCRCPSTLKLETRARPALLNLKDELDRLPVDARLDLEKRDARFRRSTAGCSTSTPRSRRSRRAARARRALRRAGLRGTAAAARRRRARQRARSTTCSAASRRATTARERTQARTYNLRLAASKLDGYVLLPGRDLRLQRRGRPARRGQRLQGGAR